MAWTLHGHHIPGSPIDESTRPKGISYCGGVSICATCKYDVVEYKANVKPETPKDLNSGEGWYEFIHVEKATTHIAYLGENGDIYLPEEGLIHADFIFAAARNMAFKLVRVQDLTEIPD